LDTLTLRFYVSGEQLADLRLGQDIEVLTDAGANDFRHWTGTISHIADEAEFTPKTIQTKEDRVYLVYAVQAHVANPEGVLKIGMPAEVRLHPPTNSNTPKPADQ
ncbi:MAG: HlyD family secretion protein, partial [Bacteroidetes bacterium]